MALQDPTLQERIRAFLNCEKDKHYTEEDLLSMMLAQLSGIGSSIVTERHDKVEISYIGATNNIDTVVYSLDGVTVATLTMAYIGGVPATDDALLASVTKS